MPLTNDLSNLAAEANALFNSITANSTAITALSVGGQTINSTGISVNSTFTNTFTIGTSAYFVANGNVGIGTSTPAGKLQVNGGSANDVGPEIKITGSAGYLDMHNNLSVGSYNNITVEGDKGIIFSSGTANTGSLVIAPWFNGTAGIRITNNGSVGIGVSSPAQTLQVAGVAWIGGTTATGSTVAIYSNGNTSATIEALNPADINTKRNLGLQTFGGNVGIRTSSPSTALTVNGSITTTTTDQGVYVGGSLSTDFGIRQQSDQLVFNWKTTIWIGMGSDNIWSFNNGGGISIGGSHSRTSDFTYYAKGNPNLIGYAATTSVSDVSLYAGARIWAREFNAHSDVRLKDVLGKLEVSEAKKFIDLVEPKKYKWISEGENGSVHIGLIAQDVAKAGFFGMLATYDNNNLKEEEYNGVMQPAGKQMLLDYNQIQPMLMVLVKDLYDQIDKLNNKIIQLEVKNN